MASLTKRVVKLSNVSRKMLTTQTSVRFVAAWNLDWKPGPYPKTEEERIAAAKKYNLHPDDYMPGKDDGYEGAGDYPMLAPWNPVSRSVYVHYDYPEFRRDFGEPLQMDFDGYTMERIDPNQEFPLPIFQMFLLHISVVGFLAILHYLGDYKYAYQRPMMDKHMPKEGEVHYHFDKF